jgi:hypothetical protein
MKRLEAWSVHVSTLLVAGTGLVYAWMRYLAPGGDPYSVVRHPWQPAAQHLHVLVAPLLVFATGLIWKQHVWGHWRRGVPQRRRSGLALLLALVPMVVSGYLIQTTVGDGWRRAWVGVHLAASALFLLGYASHALAALRLWWRQRSDRVSDPAAARDIAA